MGVETTQLSSASRTVASEALKSITRSLSAMHVRLAQCQESDIPNVLPFIKEGMRNIWEAMDSLFNGKMDAVGKKNGGRYQVMVDALQEAIAHPASSSITQMQIIVKLWMERVCNNDVPELFGGSRAALQEIVALQSNLRRLQLSTAG